jgi:geranylgeranyl diphosphate synthase, type II
MHSADSLQEELNRVFSSLNIPSGPEELYDPIRYTLSLGGKRIRPLLVLMGCDLYGGDPDNAVDVAAGIELFHNFTLLHDDIMDQASLRRGKETVYKKWNSNIAILSGDTMFALATAYISKVKADLLPEVLELFTLTARQVCEGQQLDMNFETRKSVSLTEYMEMIRLKTAVLIACSLRLGAVIAGADQKEKDLIYSFGENLGLAFQLQDDLLDTFGLESKFGKEIGGDILAQKKTFLYVKAMDLANETQQNELVQAFSDIALSGVEKIRQVKERYRELHIDKITKSAISDYFCKALECLDLMNVGQFGKSELKRFADNLLIREH